VATGVAREGDGTIPRLDLHCNVIIGQRIVDIPVRQVVLIRRATWSFHARPQASAGLRATVAQVPHAAETVGACTSCLVILTRLGTITLAVDTG
jgi:hypothetical protein